MVNDKKVRILLVAERCFPDGDAGGVRVLYMAKMFQLLGFEVVVLSIGENSCSDFDSEKRKYTYKGVTYINQPVSKDGFQFVQRYIYTGLHAAKSVRMIADARYNDVVILYSTNFLYCLIFLFKTRDCNYRIWMDVVEFFHRNSYAFGVFNPRYILYRFCLYYIYPKYKRVFSISSYIEDKYQKMGCQVVRMPPLYEYKKEVIRDKSYDISNKIKLIYSGNPGKKENLSIMLGALCDLPDHIKQTYEMHFTGVCEDELNNLLRENKNLLELLSDNMFFHSWMDYKDLQKLYLEMNFLYFIRDDNESNRANFPMKMIELMSYGVVPFVSKVGDYGRMLTNGIDSVVVENVDIESVVSSLMFISNMSNNDYSDLSRGAFNYGQKYFDISSFASNNESLINTITE